MKKTFLILLALFCINNNIFAEEITEAKVHYSVLVPFYNTCVEKAKTEEKFVGEAYCMCCTNLVRNEMTLSEFMAFAQQAQKDDDAGVDALTTVEANEKFKSIVYRCVQYIQTPLESKKEETE